jgi:hypothetical protein
MNMTAYDEIETKDYAKAERMARSETARSRRKTTKQIREAKLLNDWARKRRARKNK